MLRKLISTNDDPIALVLRLALGLVIFPHGAQKLLGWFGGFGYHGTMGFFTQNLHIPAFFAFLAIVAEFFGGLGLVLGLLGRGAAFGVSVVMAVAVVLAHAHNGFFMNWAGNKTGEGFEYHILALAIGLAVMIRGSGAFSIDRVLTRRFEAHAHPTRDLSESAHAHS